MDYLTARWYIVRKLPQARLKELHIFENAVMRCAARGRRGFYRRKILPPLWWQEGALFLRAEFKSFWQAARANPADITAFKNWLDAVFKAAAPYCAPQNILGDINLMHKCDLIINAPINAHQKPPR